jgi:putative restriction endonuclease
MNQDSAVRLAAFNWLSEMTRIHGDVLPRRILQEGFTFGTERIPLIAPQGIFKPRILEIPLSITTTPHGPYNDSFRDGFLRYRYRGKDIHHRDNVGLRKAMQKEIPLVYFHGVVPGKYLAVWPVFVTGDDPGNLVFRVAVDDFSTARRILDGQPVIEENPEIRRAYITSNVRVRLHQRSFREKVLAAYRSQCALCRLRHAELLDAAHIIPDSDPLGDARVDNGLSLCRLHHAAYDSFLLTINPDYVVEVRKDILDEIDGPMLQHGLKEMHNVRIILPHAQVQRPNRDLLELRYQRFRSAGEGRLSA